MKRTPDSFSSGPHQKNDLLVAILLFQKPSFKSRPSNVVFLSFLYFLDLSNVQTNTLPRPISPLWCPRPRSSKGRLLGRICPEALGVPRSKASLPVDVRDVFPMKPLGKNDKKEPIPKKLIGTGGNDSSNLPPKKKQIVLAGKQPSESKHVKHTTQRSLQIMGRPNKSRKPW